MPRVLVIDDDPLYHKIIARGLQPMGYEIEVAQQGETGIQKARETHPDVIITDVMMPDISGYDVARQLRREPEFAFTPIIVLSSQTGLQAKLSSFEAGADDYIMKPFEPVELAARLTALLRRSENAKATLAVRTVRDEARFIVVHSLRGGTGASSLAVNLAIGVHSLWRLPTILLDLNMIAGQTALMLNSTIKRSWADLATMQPEEIDMKTLESITNKHDSGIAFISSPASAAEAEKVSGGCITACIQLFKTHYGYIIADAPHDFGPISLAALDAANMVLLIATPDMASVHAAAVALETYQKLNYPPEKIKLILNATFPKHGLSKEKIEQALSTSISATIPYLQDYFVEAINYGRPLLVAKPDEPITGMFEDMAFMLSKDIHKKTKPDTPTETWQRVYRRFQARRK